MQEQNNSENREVVQPEIEHVQEQPQGVPSGGTLAIQNNNYFTQQIDLVALGKLTTKDPEIAKMYMAIQQEQFDHSKSVDNRILTIEEKEQEARHTDIPNKKTYAFRAQLGSFAIVFGAFATAMVFGYFDMEKAAITSIVTGAGVIAVNFLGVRNKGQK